VDTRSVLSKKRITGDNNMCRDERNWGNGGSLCLALACSPRKLSLRRSAATGAVSLSCEISSYANAEM
jgi:hypothetical protein